MTGTKCHAKLLVLARLALAVLALASLSAGAADNVLSNSDQACLGCHAAGGLEKKLADGETLSLQVDGAAFARSVHSKMGCAVCHRDITLQNHPPLKAKIASVRENSITLAKVCTTCHGDILKRYEHSIHATLVREGNARAPICTDCHNPHAVMAKSEYVAATGAPCSKCHASIFEAYAGSVHGKAGLGCPSCHRAHDVRIATAGDRLKKVCLECHQDVLAAHKKWLPNAAQHFDTVTCSACHAPAAKRKVDLRLYDSATKQRVAEREGVPQFERRMRLVNVKGSALDALELYSLLREFNRDEPGSKTTLRGLLEVRSGVEAHRLTDKSHAIRNCVRCHRQGADAFQSVTVSIVGPDGRPVRYGAKPEVLNSMISVDSVGGFYAIGGTRIKFLDWLLALAALGGIGVPLGHLTINWIVRRSAKRIGGREDS